MEEDECRLCLDFGLVWEEDRWVGTGGEAVRGGVELVVVKVGGDINS